MTQNATICVGTLGQGIWRSSDGGATWLRVRHGLYSESAVRALAVHPSDARIMYCGATAACTAARTAASIGSGSTRP